MKDVVYIAGPMRGRPNFNYAAFRAAQARLEAAGYEVVNPADMDIWDGPEMAKDDAEATKRGRILAKRDLVAIIDRCTHLALLPGWADSIGANAEYRLAMWLKLHVIDAETFNVIEYGDPVPFPERETIRNGEFEIKDSGDRTEFSTGAKRDTDDNKGYWHLIPFNAMLRLARLYQAGALKYGKSNWKKGIPLSRYIDAAARHLFKLSEGWVDEDHAAAVMWNAAGFIWTSEAIASGDLPAELNDIDFPITKKAA